MTTAADVQDRTLTLNGLRFHYLDWGNVGGQPLIALHGFTSHAHSWDNFAELGLDRFVLVGLSMGGRCVYQYTARHPQKVERLVIVDIAPESAAPGMRR